MRGHHSELTNPKIVKTAESWTGEGSMKCYGQMNILASRPFVDVTGTAECRPRVAPANPQGFIADGADGSHWVTLNHRF